MADVEKASEKGEAGEKYYDVLVDAYLKSQESYDKAVLSLSGGALGVSIAFIKNIVGGKKIQSPLMLELSWICWTVSLVIILLSLLSSTLAAQRALSQYRAGALGDDPGGFFNKVTRVLNPLGGLLFIIGVVFMLLFTQANIGGS